MIILKRIFIFIIITLTACCGTPEKKPVFSKGESLSVTGTVNVSGSEPFTRLVLRTDGSRDAFFLPGSMKKSKKSFIGKTIKVSGRIDVKELKSADGKYTVYEYHIIPDKIEEMRN